MQKCFRPFLTHDIKGNFILNSDWSVQCYTNALCISFFYLWWNIYKVIYISSSSVVKGRKNTKQEFPSGAGM